MGQISLVQEAIPFINERGSFTLVSGVLNEEPIFAGVAGATVSGALEGFCSGCRRRTSQGIAHQFGESYDPKRIEASYGFALSRRNSGSKAGEWHRPTNARFSGENRPRYKVDELAQRLKRKNYEAHEQYDLITGGAGGIGYELPNSSRHL